MASKKGDVPPRIKKMDEPIPKSKKLISDNVGKGSGLSKERGKSKGAGAK